MLALVIVSSRVVNLPGGNQLNHNQTVANKSFDKLLLAYQEVQPIND